MADNQIFQKKFILLFFLRSAAAACFFFEKKKVCLKDKKNKGTFLEIKFKIFEILIIVS